MQIAGIKYNDLVFDRETLNNLISTNKYLLEDINSCDLVLFGDDHNMNSGRIWLKELLPNISQRFQNLGLEYMPFPDDEYKNSDKLLRKHLKENYKYFPGFKASSIISIIKQCNTNKLNVLGIDMRPDHFEDWYNLESQKERTNFMAKAVMSSLPKGRTIALLGADHVEIKNDNVYGLIKQEEPSLKILSVVFIGGKSWSIDTEDYWIRKLELVSMEFGINKDLFFLKNLNALLPCDWVIHFPQYERNLRHCTPTY